MVYVHLGYSFLHDDLDFLPLNTVSWIPEDFKFPMELLSEDSNLNDKEIIKNLICSNDFPKFEPQELSVSEKAIGEIVERPIDIPDMGKIKKKDIEKVKKVLSEMNSYESVKSFFKSENDKRKTNRKDATTKKLEQSDWKELKSHSKVLVEKKVAIKEIKLCLFAWILCPRHKGQNCRELKEIKTNI